MRVVDMRCPEKNKLYQFRDGWKFMSDEHGIIRGVPTIGGYVFADALANGCQPIAGSERDEPIAAHP